MQEITDIFLDVAKKEQSLCFVVDADDLNLVYADKGSVCNRILSLAEVFTEWYLFDSSHEKDIQQFLNEENLTDIFTESEFIDLMCGNAYVDDKLIQFIALKLPFRITHERLHMLNHSVSGNNNSVYMIPGKPELSDKMCEVYQAKKTRYQKQNKTHRVINIEQRRKTKREYYSRNKEYISKLKHEHYLRNKEQIKQRSKEYYANNKDRIKEYYATHKEHRQKIKHDNYVKNKEYYNQRSKSYYEANKEKQSQYLKEYYIAHRDKQLQYLKKYYEEAKQNKITAQKICAAYIFLMKIKKENKEKYLKLYKKYQDPLRHMMKTCVALQNKDITMCPLCNKKCENTLERNCNQKVLSLPNAISELQTIAKDLKQR